MFFFCFVSATLPFRATLALGVLPLIFMRQNELWANVDLFELD